MLAATLLFALISAGACGGTKAKSESPLVKEGADVPATCCCKTLPETAEKEIVPNYAMVGRMECSSEHGDCVDDVQCNGSKPASGEPSATEPGESPTNTGVPPPPRLPSSGG
jgi:hypothetical protein